jgi:hypothetical protein
LQYPIQCDALQHQVPVMVTATCINQIFSTAGALEPSGTDLAV